MAKAKTKKTKTGENESGKKDAAGTYKNKQDQTKQAQQQAEKIQELIADNQSVEITLAWEKIEPVYKQKLKQLVKNLKLKGFRKGKVPLKVAEEKINQEELVNQVLQDLLPEAYLKAIEEGKYQPLTRPQFQPLNVNKDNDWQLKAFFAQKPEIDLKDYKKIAKEAKKDALKAIKQREKELAEAKKEDSGQEDQKQDPKKGKKSKKESAKKTQEKTETEEGAEESITGQQKEDMQVQMIFSRLAERLKPRVPEMLIRHNTEQELQNLHQRLEKLNVSFEDYAQSHNLTKDQLVSQVALSSLNQLQVEFLLAEIAEKEEIKATDEDIKQKIDEVEDKEMQGRMRQDKKYQNYLRSILLKQKVIRHLLNL